MSKLLKIVGGALLVIVTVAVGVGVYINSQRAAIIQKVLTQAEQIATEKLGVPVKIGGVELGNFNLFKLDQTADVTVRDIEIFDKKSELLARVNEAKINFKPIALRDDPVAALDEIFINGALVNLKQRTQDEWNFNDIKIESEGESTFGAKIFLQKGTLNADFDGKNLFVDEISGEADCADMNAVDTKISAKTLGALVTATGTLGAAQQVVNAEVDKVTVEKILPYIPADKIPDGVKILRGTAHDTKVHVLHNSDKLTYLASTEIQNAAVKVEETDVENINGHVTLNEREIFLDASAVANGQQAAASGKIRLDTDEPYFDIFAETDSFAPAAIINDIGIDGAVAVRGHLVGTADNPQVDAEIFSDRLGYDNISAQNISTKFRYVGEMVYLNDTHAQIFGGDVSGTAEIKTSDFSFNAHVKANGLDGASLCAFAGTDQNVDGQISADVGINGIRGEVAKMKVYGTASARNLNVEGILVNETNASFLVDDKDVTIDYLSANLPHGGTLGLEGTIKALKNLDLKFYGAHVDMSTLKNFNAQIDMSGLTDFTGTVNGDSENPNVTLVLSAVDNSKREGNHFVGKFFKQPFDSIQLAASGSLAGVHIDKFNLEKDGKLKWTVVEGSVGLTGEKVIDIQLDTNLARAEDIAALVAPDQPITGNVTNTVKITGTIDAPKIAGNIKFNRGSYRGVLLSGMKGDYFLDGDILRLQDFEITSPMVDMVLNGTINKSTQEMNFVVTGNDINLERFKGKLPDNYVAEGHSKFEGLITGTPAVPIFDGTLTADEIFLNGIALTKVFGHVATNGANVYLDEFRFDEGDGIYQVQVSANLDYETVSGEIDVTNANIGNLLTIADQKTDLLEGTLNSKILVGGTFRKPTGSLTGEIPIGKLAGYDIHGIKVSVNMNNNVIYVNQLEGYQGDKGTFNLSGSANPTGALDLILTAKELELGLFSAAAGFKDLDMHGTSNIVAKVSGTVNDPFGELLWTATGSIKGSTFDLLHGHFLLKDQRVNVEELSIQRELGGKTYGASIRGFVPFQAVLATQQGTLPPDEQLDLTVSLDGADLSLLPVVSNQVAWGVGDLNGSLKITGTAAHPQVDGKISLVEGSVKLKAMKNLIEHINISTVFKDERFDIEKFSGNIGAGIFKLTGGFSFPGLEFTDYNFDFVADKLDIRSSFYSGKLNANFNFSEGTIFHWTMPKLSGQVNLDNCRISIPSLPDDDSPLPNIILDVALNLGEKVHFYQSHLYDMYLVGNARFEGTTNTPKTSGTISVRRGGTLTYLESVFNIREGEAHFNQIGTFMPSLNFAAETKIGATKIYLTLNGPPDNMDLKLTSSPEMSNTEIWRLLTLRDAYSDGGGKLTATDALAIGLQMTVLADLEDALKRTLGIDQFTVSRGSGSLFEKYSRHGNDSGNQEEKGKEEKSFNVTIGKFVNDKLMVRYTHGFGGKRIHRFGVQYDLNDNIGITVDREGSNYIFGLEARYKF